MLATKYFGEAVVVLSHPHNPLMIDAYAGQQRVTPPPVAIT